MDEENPKNKSEDADTTSDELAQDKSESAKSEHNNHGLSQNADSTEIYAKRGKLKHGDYVIQVHVIEGRELKGRGWGDMSDPVVIVETMAQKQSTVIKKKLSYDVFFIFTALHFALKYNLKNLNNFEKNVQNTKKKHLLYFFFSLNAQRCLNAVWDQVLFFEFKNLDPEEINQAKCNISCFDANTISRDVLIGAFEFDLSNVYFSENHEIHRQWVALSDISGANEGIQGYLRVSIVVLGPGDEQKIHNENEEDENEAKLFSVLMPPEIEQKPYLLDISIYKVRNLATSDIGLFSEQCDPFCFAEFSGNSWVTLNFLCFFLSFFCF